MGVLNKDPLIPTTAGAHLPVTPPLAYVPSKYEPGIWNGDHFVPLEPFYHDPVRDELRCVASADVPIRGTGIPWIEQGTGSGTDYITVATPCISPYDMTSIPALRTRILDTIPDASASEQEKALPRYVPNPGLVLSSATMRDFDLETERDPHLIEAGKNYRIKALGNTNWRSVGAFYGRVGEEFTATASAPTGTTGVAVEMAPVYDVEDGVAFLWEWGGGEVDPEQVDDPHPALNPQPTETNTYERYPQYADDLPARGTGFDGTPFVPDAPGTFTGGILKAIAHKKGMILSTVAAYSVIVKIGRSTATWTKASKTLALECDTVGADIVYSTDGSAPSTPYTGSISITETKTVRWRATKLLMEDSDEWSLVVQYSETTAPDDFEEVFFSSLPAHGTDIRYSISFQDRADWYCTPTGSGDGTSPGSPGSIYDVVGTFAYTPYRDVFDPRILAGSQYRIVGISAASPPYDLRDVGAEHNWPGVEFTATSNSPAGSFSDPSGIKGASVIEIPATGPLARGPRWVSIEDGTGGAMKITRGGVWPESSRIERSDDGGETWVEVELTQASVSMQPSATYEPATAGVILFRLMRVDDSAFSHVFRKNWFLGIGISIVAKWDATAKMLAFSIDPEQDPSSLVGMRYSLDGSDPDTEYVGPIALSAPATPKAMLYHAAAHEFDFDSESDVVSFPAINPSSTSSYEETEGVAFTLSEGAEIVAETLRQRGDIVWLSEGTYDGPEIEFDTDAPNGHWYDSGIYNPEEIVVRGGYNSAFTERDVKHRKTIFRRTEEVNPAYDPDEHLPRFARASNPVGISLPNGIVDGCWAKLFSTNTSDGDEWNGAGTVIAWTDGAPYVGLIYAKWAYNCHVDETKTDCPVGASLTIFGGGNTAYCSIKMNVTTRNGNDGSGYRDAWDGFWGVNMREGQSGESAFMYVSVLEQYRDYTSHCLEADITIDVGHGGDGVSVSHESNQDIGWQVGSTGGGGGASNATLSMGNMVQSSVTLDVTVGDGGMTGDAEVTVVEPADSYLEFIAGTAIAGDGASPYASVSVGTARASSIEISAQSGRKGYAGGVGTTLIPYLYDGYRWGESYSYADSGGYMQSPFGANIQIDRLFSSTATLETAQVGGAVSHGSNADDTKVIDEDPAVMLYPSWYKTTGEQGSTSTVYIGYIRSSIATVSTSSEAVGTTGQIYAYDNYGLVTTDIMQFTTADLTCSGAYLPEISGSVRASGWRAVGETSPTYYDSDLLTFVERDATRIGGNPLRKNAVSDGPTDGWYPGWYGGTPDGEGAPLPGHGTAQGGARTWGDYWE